MREARLPRLSHRFGRAAPPPSGPVSGQSQASVLPGSFQMFPREERPIRIGFVLEERAFVCQHLQKQVVSLEPRWSAQGPLQPFPMEFEVDFDLPASVYPNVVPIGLEKRWGILTQGC